MGTRRSEVRSKSLRYHLTDMQTPVISVVIPTRNRCDVLALTLQALHRQEGLEGRFEVVVVDDGSDDATPEMLRGTNFSAFNLKTVTVEHGGPARARNRGVAVASADRVLLLGDDTIPEPGCVAAHLVDDQESAIQGMIEWDPEVGITDVMRFLAPEGPQLWFKGLEEGLPVPWTSVVSSNLSAPRYWFVEDRFDEQFTDACLEDNELAWRWHRKAREVTFDSSALCLHRHRYEDVEQFLVRQRRAGWWTRYALRKHPRMSHKLLFRPLVATAVLAVCAAWRGVSGSGRRKDLWMLQCRWQFARGLVSSRQPG